MDMKKIHLKKFIYIILGSLTLLIGTIGIFVPVLPTTPLLLLTGYFYVRSSKKLYLWLIYHRIFGAYIYSYIQYKAIPLNTKISAISILWLSIIFSIYLVKTIWLQLMLGLIASIVTFYISSLATLSDEKITEFKRMQETFRI